jgi:hypothetical protein
MDLVIIYNLFLVLKQYIMWKCSQIFATLKKRCLVSTSRDNSVFGQIKTL